jgi:hypothetical protein
LTRLGDAGRFRRTNRTNRRSEVIDVVAVEAPATPEAARPGSMARQFGVTAATAAAAGRRIAGGLAEEHGPAVEAKVRRTLRGAGRAAGRLADRKPRSDRTPGTPPETPS